MEQLRQAREIAKNLTSGFGGELKKYKNWIPLVIFGLAFICGIVLCILNGKQCDDPKQKPTPATRIIGLLMTFISLGVVLVLIFNIAINLGTFGEMEQQKYFIPIIVFSLAFILGISLCLLPGPECEKDPKTAPSPPTRIIGLATTFISLAILLVIVGIIVIPLIPN